MTGTEGEGHSATYCPKCGDTLVVTETGLKCERGKMELSSKLNEMMRSGTPSRVKLGKRRPPETGIRRDAPWYCPACGSRLPPGTRELTCEECGRVLSWAEQYALVELHPHLAWPPYAPNLGERLRIGWAHIQGWLRPGA
jgi:predicted RNA-binding Zn-ribbon protein involved in translation (DUF1610 family)